MKKVDDFVKKDEGGLLQMAVTNKTLKFKDFLNAPDKLEKIKDKGKDKALGKEKITNFNKLNEGVDSEKDKVEECNECNEKVNQEAVSPESPNDEKVNQEALSPASPSVSPILVEANTGGVIEPNVMKDQVGPVIQADEYNPDALAKEDDLQRKYEEGTEQQDTVDASNVQIDTSGVPPEGLGAPEEGAVPEEGLGAPEEGAVPEEGLGAPEEGAFPEEGAVPEEGIVPEEGEEVVTATASREEVQKLIDEINAGFDQIDNMEADAERYMSKPNRPEPSADMGGQYTEQPVYSDEQPVMDNLNTNIYETFMNWNTNELNVFFTDNGPLNEADSEQESQVDTTPPDNDTDIEQIGQGKKEFIPDKTLYPDGKDFPDAEQQEQQEQKEEKSE